jgi:hypothetical protein
MTAAFCFFFFTRLQQKVKPSKAFCQSYEQICSKIVRPDSIPFHGLETRHTQAEFLAHIGFQQRQSQRQQWNKGNGVDSQKYYHNQNEMHLSTAIANTATTTAIKPHSHYRSLSLIQKSRRRTFFPYLSRNLRSTFLARKLMYQQLRKVLLGANHESPQLRRRPFTRRRRMNKQV